MPTNHDHRYTARVIERIDSVAPDDWNRLAAGNPFVRHEFLEALESCDCVGEEQGWLPQHLLLEDNGKLVGCTPMYLKWHSHGEFVFDWSWAQAYANAGCHYYPKLLTAIPFTPAIGPRLLVAPDNPATYRQLLLTAGIQAADSMGVSSLHWLFVSAQDKEAMQALDVPLRMGYQFHWENTDYRCFQDYLDCLTSKRRKQIRKERREAAQAGLTIDIIRGGDVTSAEWHAYHHLYAATYDRKWGYPALSVAFFERMGALMPDSILLILARRGTCYVAGAHCFQGADTLYGRNWGRSEYFPSLHFEMCYYRLIEYCIATGLRHLDAGAQGEHKLMRGFLPITTWSGHWIRDPRFRKPIVDFLQHEKHLISGSKQQFLSHSPYRSQPP